MTRSFVQNRRHFGASAVQISPIFPLSSMHFALFVFVVVLLAPTACLCGTATTASGTEQRARTVTHNKRQIADLKSTVDLIINWRVRVIIVLCLQFESRFNERTMLLFQLEQNAKLNIAIAFTAHMLNYSKLPVNCHPINRGRLGLGSVRFGVG